MTTQLILQHYQQQQRVIKVNRTVVVVVAIDEANWNQIIIDKSKHSRKIVIVFDELRMKQDSSVNCSRKQSIHEFPEKNISFFPHKHFTFQKY